MSKQTPMMQLMNETELRQMFKNISDCYADTGRFEKDGSYTEGDAIQAITEDRFISFIHQLARKMLPIEQQAIEDAFNSGVVEGELMPSPCNGRNHYNQTYKS